MNSETHTQSYEGGSFLIEEGGPAASFVPENFEESIKEMARAAQDFHQKQVAPQAEALEKGELSINTMLLEQAAAQGLLGLNMPQSYGGLGLSTHDSLLITEALAQDSSFSTTYGAHTGIGTLPILYYGSPAQKKKYLPKLISATYKACYCLTEPQAGSDAAAGRSRATPKGDVYLLSGQKMWISNAGFADIFIVFAKIEKDEKLSAFIVEKSYGGIELQAEEHKLGLKGSSTRQVFFADCPVPKENLLAERGQGFKIAVNILNAGRLKLAAGTLGTAKRALKYAIDHAQARKQFGRALVDFGAIQQKMGAMSTRIFACESATYRTGAAIAAASARRQAGGLSPEEAQLQAMEAYAVECALLKVQGSETLDYVIDEALQIYGGMGYSEEAPIARMYRDARITRIYEGTNEINRMLVVGMLLRRAEKGLLPLLDRAKAIGDTLLQVPAPPTGCEGPLQSERQRCEKLKELLLLVAGRAAQILNKELNEAQEILMYAADIAIELYMSESALLRAARLTQDKLPNAALAATAARSYLHHATQHIRNCAENIVGGLPLGTEEKKILSLSIRRFSKTAPLNPISLQREVATAAITRNAYPFTYY